MTFIDSLKTCFIEKPFTFKGRASRSEFWFSMPVFICLMGLIAFVLSHFGSKSTFNTIIQVIGIVILIIILIIYLAASVRRLHDTNRSGWFVLVRFIPYIGSLIVLYALCIKSDVEANAYGDVPDDIKKTQKATLNH